MADLSIDFCGVTSPNPYWLASGPPTNSGEQVMRAFEAGWGGAVWKMLGEPIVNVNSRFGAMDICLLYTSPSPRDRTRSRMPSSA